MTTRRLAAIAWPAAVFLAAAAAAPAGEVHRVTLDDKTIVCRSFLGFGAQWDSRAWPDYGIDAQDRALMEKRLAWMRMPIVRMMVLAQWVYLGDGRYDWENEHAKGLLAQLDACQRLGITVFLSDWGCVRDWVRVAGVKDTADPAYARVIGGYLDELVNKRKYTCIRYFILVNEPNNEAGGYDAWKAGVLNVHAELARRGLDKRIVQVGSDASQCDLTWHRNSARDLADVLGVYDLHQYVDVAMLTAGRLEAHWRRMWDIARQIDPKAAGKPMLVGEAGMNTHAVHPRGNRDIDNFGYGLNMADYAVQAARAGSSAVSAWMLDDNAHKDFFWGLWGNKPAGMKLRPWFTPWGLMCRYVPAGATVFAPPQPGDRVRLLAARATANDGQAAWTFVVVNRGADEAKIAFRVADAPADRPVKMSRYLYRDAARPADADGFPLPEAAADADLAKGVEFACPPNAMAMLTTER